MTERKKVIILYIISAILLLCCFVVGIWLGSVKIGIKEAVIGLFSKDTIVYGIRLPRVVGAALAGAALSCAGLILQCITANGLCAPNIIGINSGAGMAIMIILCFFPFAWMLIPIAAFIGALSTALLVLAISSCGKSRFMSASLVIAGIAVSSMMNAVISFLSLRFPEVLSSYTAFSIGGFSSVEFDELLFPCIIVLCSLIIAQIISPKLSLLCLGDDVACSLGVNVKLLRGIAVVVASALCAAAVSFAGLLGFVGLVVPHIVRHLAGQDMRINIFLSALWGAILVILSDTFGRFIFRPTELPCGIIMALIGAPFFLFLLLKRRSHND